MAKQINTTVPFLLLSQKPPEAVYLKIGDSVRYTGELKPKFFMPRMSPSGKAITGLIAMGLMLLSKDATSGNYRIIIDIEGGGFTEGPERNPLVDLGQGETYRLTMGQGHNYFIRHKNLQGVFERFHTRYCMTSPIDYCINYILLNTIPLTKIINKGSYTITEDFFVAESNIKGESGSVVGESFSVRGEKDCCFFSLDSAPAVYVIPKRFIKKREV